MQRTLNAYFVGQRRGALMTLIVSAFWANPATGQREEFTDWSEGHEMAGVERARTEIWDLMPSSSGARTFLPRLEGADLWVEHGELDAFVAEVTTLLRDLDVLRVELGRAPDCSLEHDFKNFLRAAKYARPRRGGISIS